MYRKYTWVKGRYHPRARVLYCQAKGIPLESITGKIIHHLNGKCWDDRIENLVLVEDKKHRSEHFRGKNNPRYIGWTKEQVLVIAKPLVEKIGVRKQEWEKHTSRGSVPTTRTIQKLFGSWSNFQQSLGIELPKTHWKDRRQRGI